MLDCPSGALAFVRHDGAPQEAPDVPTTVTQLRNGPLYVRGDLEVRALDGQLIRRGTRMSLCRCGLAHQMPFCDNTCRKERWREPVPSTGESGASERG